jgi:hypothetical protein
VPAWESLLPPELLRLPEEQARVDALLDDPAFFAPFAPYFHPVLGRPSTPSSVTTLMRGRSARAASTARPGFGYKAQVIDNDDGIILDYGVQAGNPPDAPQLAPAISPIARRARVTIAAAHQAKATRLGHRRRQHPARHARHRGQDQRMSDLETLGEYRPDRHRASLPRGSRARYRGVAATLMGWWHKPVVKEQALRRSSPPLAGHVDRET